MSVSPIFSSLILIRIYVHSPKTSITKSVMQPWKCVTPQLNWYFVINLLLHNFVWLSYWLMYLNLLVNLSLSSCIKLIYNWFRTWLLILLCLMCCLLTISFPFDLIVSDSFNLVDRGHIWQGTRSNHHILLQYMIGCGQELLLQSYGLCICWERN